MHYVYQIRNLINGKFYIGITNNLRKRWLLHLSHARTGANMLISRAIRKHGKDNFEFTCLMQNEDRNLVAVAEIELISQARELLGRGAIYNVCDGGHGGLAGYKHSDATKAKISTASSRPLMIKQIAELGKSMRGRRPSESTRKKMSEARKRIPPKAMSRDVAGGKNPRAKPVYVNGREFTCLKHAAIEEGINYSTLKRWFSKFSKTDSFPNGWGWSQ
jgi:group I intron endonuclease